jgi:hypothetical protein
MRFKSDFTTNSSSSSFIVAKRNDCTKEDLEALIKDAVTEFITHDAEYCYEYEEMVETHGKRKAKGLMIKKIIDNIWEMGRMTLDNWTVESGESSSEGNLVDSFLYNRGHFDSEKFKIGG